ncbi:MAG: polysaccharide deacetylase family protein, partial [Halanaerobiales bacterium]
MLKKSRLLLLFAIFLGMLWGIISYDLIVPVQTEPVTPYYHGTRGLNNIALTVNVDWGEEYIPDMLEVLSEYNIKATFFVTGKWVEKNPELLKKIHDKGHEIGNHGYLHLHPADLSPSSLHKLIKKNEDLIYKLTGKQTKLFAPPYGEVNDKIVKSASDIGYKTIMWSADTIDWQRPSP